MSKDQIEEESYEDAFNSLVDGDDDESGTFEAESSVDESEESEALDGEEGESEDEDSEDSADSGISEPQETPRDDKGRFKSKDEELNTLREEAQKWQHRYNSDLGRQNALQRKIQEQDQQLSQFRKAQQQAQSQSPSGMSPAEWETLKEDFPEIAAAMESRLSVIGQQYESKISRLEQQLQPIQRQAHEQYRNAQYQILENQHPDWQTIAKTPEFRQWIDTQPRAVAQLMESDEAADAAYLIGNYKLNTQPIQSDDLKLRREKQLRQGQTLSNRGGRKKSALPAEDDYEASFNYFADK